jgi:hypothetical protein
MILALRQAYDSRIYGGEVSEVDIENCKTALGSLHSALLIRALEKFGADPGTPCRGVAGVVNSILGTAMKGELRRSQKRGGDIVATVRSIVAAIRAEQGLTSSFDVHHADPDADALAATSSGRGE